MVEFSAENLGVMQLTLKCRGSANETGNKPLQAVADVGLQKVMSRPHWMEKASY